MSNDVDAGPTESTSDSGPSAAPVNANANRDWSWPVFGLTAAAVALPCLALVDQVTELKIPFVADLLDVMDKAASNLGVIVSTLALSIAGGAITWNKRRSDPRPLNVRRPVLWGSIAGLAAVAVISTAAWMTPPTATGSAEHNSSMRTGDGESQPPSPKPAPSPRAAPSTTPGQPASKGPSGNSPTGSPGQGTGTPTRKPPTHSGEPVASTLPPTKDPDATLEITLPRNGDNPNGSQDVIGSASLPSGYKVLLLWEKADADEYYFASFCEPSSAWFCRSPYSGMRQGLGVYWIHVVVLDPAAAAEFRPGTFLAELPRGVAVDKVWINGGND